MRIFKDKTFLKIISLVISLTLVYLFFLSNLTIFRISRLKASDTFIKLVSTLKPAPKSQNNIVVIAIDDLSLAKVAHKWPWPRKFQTELLKKIGQYKPKVIVFDISFIGKSEDQNDDIEFAEELKKQGNCVIASHFSPKGEYILPLEILQESAKVGFTNKPRDKDNYIRSTRLVVMATDGKVLDYSLEMKIMSQIFGSEIEYNKTSLNFRNKTKIFSIPISDIGTILINYKTKKTDFKTIPFWEALNNNITPETFNNKILFIGATSEVIHDIYPTALGIMPGVAISANTLQTILEKDFIYILPLWIQRIIALVLAFFIAFITYRYSLGKAFFLNTEILLAVFLTYLKLFTYNVLADFSSILYVGLGTFLGISGFSYLRLAIEANILKNQAITDGLTQIYGFRYFDLRLKSEFDRSRRYRYPLSLLILDIDHFKQINDTYGHDNGNIILQKIAKMLKDFSRKADVVARFGGEEFCAILPHIKQDAAFLFAERIRKKIEETHFPIKGNKDINLTVSIGISSLNNKMKAADDFLKASDTALYKAKNSGRNKVCVS